MKKQVRDIEIKISATKAVVICLQIGANLYKICGLGTNIQKSKCKFQINETFQIILKLRCKHFQNS